MMKNLKTILLLLTISIFGQSIAQTKTKIPVPSRETIEEFYDAIFADNTQKVLKMIGTKFPANYEPKNKILPLQAAIWQKNLTVVKALTEGGANINNPTLSVVDTAAEKGAFEILSYFIQKGAKISNKSFNIAGFYQSYNCAKLLLQKGANQDGGDIRGKFWVFEQAVRKSDYEVLKALKLDKDEINYHNYDGETALIIAIKNKNIDMVKYLLQRGVDKNKPETFDAGDDISYGKKPIQIATKMKLTEIVKLLK
ncbi:MULTISPECIES: ankyrin repeat domain-containing protein [Flavobacterium]|uniref:ankyrin repeat domain-containing protein n=1 Tax=Flavobacterium TaxID=237 RepID=UPI0011843A3C|nr:MULTISPECIES: ankyrin repeat domain-containing protein [Flavobacterium]MCR4030586.1 ankyrin repeat domain-containing protein [Flavobacterium panacis]